MATRMFNVLDSTNLLYGLRNVHHTPGVPHYTTDPLSVLEGTLRHRRKGGMGRFSHTTNVRADSRSARWCHEWFDRMTHRRSSISPWTHTCTFAASRPEFHYWTHNLDHKLLRVTLTPLKIPSALLPQPAGPLFRWLFSVTFLHYFSCNAELCSGPLAQTQSSGGDETDGASDLAELPPLYRSFSSRYSCVFLTGRTDRAEYKFLCMPESCSDPWICTQEAAASLKIHGASHPRCTPGCSCNVIICLITGNPNRHYIRFTSLHHLRDVSAKPK